MELKNVLCVAESCCDLIFGGLPRIPEPGEEVYCEAFEIRAGGGANTPLNLARLGVEVKFLTALGADEPGRKVLQILQDSGMKLGGSLSRPGMRTPVSAVLSTGGDRSFASFAGSAGRFTTPEELEEEISRAAIVHTYPGYCREYPISELCRRYGVPLSFDLASGDATPETVEIIRGAAIVKASFPEARRLTGEETPERAAAAMAELVSTAAVVTLGGEGSVGVPAGDGKAIWVPAVRVERFLDACGAGDAYAAGFLYGFLQGGDLEACMRSGSRLAGECVGRYGGNDGSVCSA